MGIDDNNSNLPAQLSDVVASVPKYLVPSAVKALDRLIGAAIDVPVAWLEQKAAKINSQTESFRQVEAAIASNVALEAGSDPETSQRAMNVLVRREYRKQINREAVAVAMIEDLRNNSGSAADSDEPKSIEEVNEDWLNVFERYAEDASSERLQGLWARVLAGEIRKPGKFSTRTLRFLSEFSQADASFFEEFSKSAFSDAAPVALAKPNDNKDISHLIHLESSGLIQGASGLGLQRILSFNSEGFVVIVEGDVMIVFKGEPNTSFLQEIVVLTPLGQELLSLVPTRDLRATARRVANAWRTPEIQECYIGEEVASSEAVSQVSCTETVWLREENKSEIIEVSVN